MLILTRKPGESLYIGDNVKVVIVEVTGSQVRIGIEADKSLRIYREEIYLQILEENRSAAAGAQNPEAGLEGLSEAWKGKREPGSDKEKGTIRSLSIPSSTVKALGDKVGGDLQPKPLEVLSKRKKKSTDD